MTINKEFKYIIIEMLEQLKPMADTAFEKISNNFGPGKYTSKDILALTCDSNCNILQVLDADKSILVKTSDGFQTPVSENEVFSIIDSYERLARINKKDRFAWLVKDNQDVHAEFIIDFPLRKKGKTMLQSSCYPKTALYALIDIKESIFKSNDIKWHWFTYKLRITKNFDDLNLSWFPLKLSDLDKIDGKCRITLCLYVKHVKDKGIQELVHICFYLENGNFFSRDYSLQELRDFSRTKLDEYCQANFDKPRYLRDKVVSEKINRFCV